MDTTPAKRPRRKSFKQWLKDFYPVEAQLVKKEDAVEHSIRKWQGLKPDVLKGYNVHFDRSNGELVSNRIAVGFLEIDATTCSLCQLHYQETPHSCQRCPLYLSRGRVPCYQLRMLEGRSPYAEFFETGDPSAMLRALYGAAVFEADHEEFVITRESLRYYQPGY